jgi:putative thioredoxin
MGSEYIIDINDTNFEYEVVQYSLNTPVVIDFWAEWCKPCKTLTPLLEMLAHEAGGSFRLARVNVDQCPNLAIQFGVRTIPTIKAFSQGEVVGEVVGLQPEPRLRDFIAGIMPPSPLTLAIEKANSLLALRQWSEAEKLYTDILEQAPDNPACLLGMVKIYIIKKQPDKALEILRDFPASRYYTKAEALLPLVETLAKFTAGKFQATTDQDQTFTNSLNLVMRGNFAAALDGLLGVLRENKSYRNGLARQVYLSILEMMGEEDPETREYRNELASALF